MSRTLNYPRTIFRLSALLVVWFAISGFWINFSLYEKLPFGIGLPAPVWVARVIGTDGEAAYETIELFIYCSTFIVLLGGYFLARIVLTSTKA